MSQEDQRKSAVRGSLADTDLPDTLKILEKCISATSLDLLSDLCKTCCHALHKKPHSITFPKHLPSKLIVFLENLHIDSNLMLFSPIIELFSHIYTAHPLPLSQLLINSLCSFLTTSKTPSSDPYFIHFSIKILDFLYHLASQKKKKLDAYDPSWPGKIFNTFCVFFENLIKDQENDYWARDYFTISHSLIISPDAKILQVLRNFDIILYTAIGISQLGKLVNSGSEYVITMLPGFMGKVIRKTRELEDFIGEKPQVELEKIVAAFGILNTLAAMVGKIENFRLILKTNWDKIKDMFYWGVLGFCKSTAQAQSQIFEDEPMVIGRLFSELLDMSVSTLNSDMESFPILLFHQFSLPEISERIREKREIQVFTLEFIHRFLRLGLKKSKIPELGVVEMLFSQVFFTQNRTHSAWSSLYLYIHKLPESTNWLALSIVSALSLFPKDQIYYSEFFQWFNECIQESDDLVIGLIQNKFLESILLGLQNLKNPIQKSSKNNEIEVQSSDLFVEFFVMLKSLLYTFEIPEGLDYQITEFLLQDNLIKTTSTADLSLACLTPLLRLCGPSAYQKFLIVLKNTSDILVIKKLLETIQDVLKESEKAFCQQNFISAGVFKIFKDLLFSQTDSKSGYALWPLTLECIRFLIHDNLQGKDHLDEFDFYAIANLLLSPDYKKRRVPISESCIEIAFYILFESTNLEIFHEIVTPQIVPLICAFLSSCLSPLSSYLLTCLDYPYNAVQFALNGCSKIISSEISTSMSLEIFGFMTELMEKTLCYNIPPKDLKAIIKNSQLLAISRQERFFMSFARSMQKSFVTNEDLAEGLNQMLLNPTSYFWFHRPTSNLRFSSENTCFLPKKDFCIIAWVFPLTKNQACLADFYDKKSHFLITTSNRTVEVAYYYDKKLSFKLQTGQVLIDNKWNLLCISCQQITKFITTQSIYEINVNNRNCDFLTEGKICSFSSNFNTLVLGNTQDLKLCYNGKVAVFYIANRTFNDFSQIYSANEQLHLPFISEAFTVFSHFNCENYRDLTKSLHFDANSIVELIPSEDIAIEKSLEIVNGIDAITSVINAGGIEIFLPLFKDCEFMVALQVLETISCLCQSRAIDMMITEDYFEVLASILESLVIPNEDLLEVIKKIIGRLDWNPIYQSQSFRFLMINSKIWNNLAEEIQENYLGTLSLYIPKHLKCILEDCFPLYTHLSNLTPLPIDFFAENLAKLLPRVIELKNFDALSFLLLKMSQDNIDLLEKFLKETSLNKYSKDCIKEVTFLLLHFLDWPQNYTILTGLLQVFKTVIEILVREYANDKKYWADEDIFQFILAVFDRRIGQEISLEVLLEIKSIAELSYGFSSKNLSEKFAMFIDLITSRIVYLQNDCVEVFVKATEVDRFSVLVTERPNFPDWLVGCYFSDLAEAHELGINLFSYSLQVSHLHKLRMFLLSVSKQNINKALDFFHKVLEKLMLKSAFDNKLHYFLDYTAILEDILNPDLTGRINFDGQLYTNIINSLVQSSIALSLVHCTYPPLPKMDFSLQYELLKETPMKTISQQDFIYLREGGFLRLILKYIFIGLHYFQTSLLIRVLVVAIPIENVFKMVVKNPESIESFGSLTKKNIEKSFVDFESERYSIAYPNFPVRNGDLLCSEEFICLYVLAEITDLLSTTADQAIVDFTLEFLQHYDLSSILMAWSKKITIKELEDCYKMLKECRLQCYVTSRSRLHYMERNPHLELLKTITSLPLNVFLINFQDQAQLLSDAKNNEHLLRELLSSQNWIARVHVFIVAFTSMKLNFISGMVKFHSMHLRKSSAPEFISQVLSVPEEFSKSQSVFMQGKQEELKNWQASFHTSQELIKIVREKKFAGVLKFYKKIENAFVPSKLKLRWKFDALGRMSTCIYDKLKLRSSPRKKTIISSLDTKFKSSLLGRQGAELSLFETFTDDTEIFNLIGETEEEIVEENIPELKQNVQVECERIKVAYSLYGFLEISNNYLLFVSEGKEKPEKGIYFGSSLKFMQESKKSAVFCKVEDITEVFPRRYIHKHTAFEVYLKDGRSFYFNVFTSEYKDKVLEAMKSWKQVKLVTDTNGAILRSYTKQWKKCELSNMEYLLIVNKFASRSYNDLSQFPIVPWVLKDYSSDELKLDDSSIYRNLKLPVGAQSDQARQEADLRFSMGLDDYPYHFGSHYSSGAVVMHYLVRLEPFASLAKSLQGGNFDIADRLFHSIKASWDSGQGSTGDVKELVPEMFYLPEILNNSNKETLGIRQDGETVDDVCLPNWASSPLDFMKKHMQALESNYVSQNLHHWIDLIFGCKQKGKHAKNSYNIFLPMSYEENFKKVMESNEDQAYLQGMIEQVVHFGQTPLRIFHSAHPSRDSRSLETSIFDKYRKFSESTCTGCQTKGQISALLLTGKYLILVKHYSGKVSILRISLNDLNEFQVMFERKKEKYLLHSKPGEKPSHLHYCMLGENKIISGNHLDKSFKIHTIGGSLLNSVFGHTANVTCVISINNLVFSASCDSSLISWQYTMGNITLCCRYLGHVSNIIQISCIGVCFLLCSLSSVGDILIHDIRTGECLQGIKSSYTGICTSSLKLITGYNSKEVKVMDLQGKQIWKKTGAVKIARFDSSGENLYFCKDLSWGFWNIFEEHKKYEKKEELPIVCIQIATQQNYFIHSESDGKYSFVYTFQLVNKDSLMANQRINF